MDGIDLVRRQKALGVDLRHAGAQEQGEEIGIECRSRTMQAMIARTSERGLPRL